MYNLLQRRGGAGRSLKLILAGLVLQVPIATAQFTQVMGTVVDPHGIPYSNGTIMPNLIISGSPRFTATGFPYVPPSQPTGLDSRGSFVMSIADVTQLTPAGGVWSFTVNCGAGCIPPAGGVGPVTFTTAGLIISGTVQDISAVLQLAAPPLTGGGGGGEGGPTVNGNPAPFAFNLNDLTPPAPPNGLNIRFQNNGAQISGAIVGDGNASHCLRGDGRFDVCPGGSGGGSGTVGPGLVNQFAIYNGSTSIVGTPDLDDGITTPNTITATKSFLAQASLTAAQSLQVGLSTPSWFMNSTTLTSLGAALNSVPTQGGFGVATGAIPSMSINGAAYVPISYVTVNGATTGLTNQINLNAVTPAVPANGRQIVFARAGASISAALVGDGSANCLSGTGAYVACSGGGGGTVGPGNSGAFAFYPAQGSSVVGSTVLQDTLGTISSTEPFTGPVITLSPVAAHMDTNGTNVTSTPSTTSGSFGFVNGAPAISTGPNQPFTALTNGGGGSGTVGTGTVGQVAIYNGTNSVIGSNALQDIGGQTLLTAEPVILTNTTLNPPSTISGTGSATLTAISGRGSIGILSGGTPNVVAVSQNGGAFAAIMRPQVNAGGMPQTNTGFNFNNTNPAAPTFGRNITWQLGSASGTSPISAALVGDGTTNCLSGQGTYVPCGTGTGGSGTVGNGNAGQFAFYSITGNSVVGTSSFVNLGALGLQTLVPLNFGSTGIISAGGTPPAPIASTGQLFFDNTGTIEVSTSGGTFFPLGQITPGSAGLMAVYNSASNIGASTALSVASGLTTATLPILMPSLRLPSTTTLTPVAATNILAVNSTGQLVYSSNGGAFTAVGGGAAGVSSINTFAGPFNFTGAVTCTSGTPNTCNFTGTGTGIGGSGTAGAMPMFTGTSTLGNGPIFLTGTGVAPQTISIQQMQPAALNNGPGGLSAVGLATTTDIAAANCGFPVNTPQTTQIGCIGYWFNYNTGLSTNAGVNAAVMVEASPGTASLNMGLYSFLQGQGTAPEERAGYFEADDAVATANTTTRRALMAFAGSSQSGHSTPLNEAIVGQTGATNGATNTLDYTMHCLAPTFSGGTGVLTTHACMKIEPQGTIGGNPVGVEFQTGAHVFANLPACSSTYEGSIAAITDSTVTGGTITGGGTNHVLAYCNGTNWAVAGGGAGGGGGGVTPLSCVNTTQVSFNASANAIACSISLPAVAHAWITHCYIPVQLQIGAGQNTSITAGFSTTAPTAGDTLFTGYYDQPNNVFNVNHHIVSGTGNFDLVLSNLIQDTVTTGNILIDGVLNAPATAQTVSFYARNDIPAGSTGNIAAGAYCTMQ